MQLVINGKERDFPSLPPAATVADLIEALSLKGDRIALEHNGAIVRRDAWPTTEVHSGDKFEIVHFVGGGNLNASTANRSQNRFGSGRPRN